MINKSTDHGNDVPVVQLFCSSQISHVYYSLKNSAKMDIKNCQLMFLSKRNQQLGRVVQSRVNITQD